TQGKLMMLTKISTALVALAAPFGVWAAATPAPLEPPAPVHSVAEVAPELVARASAEATAHEFFGEAPQQLALTHDAGFDRLVWSATAGAQAAKIDAKTGELLELGW